MRFIFFLAVFLMACSFLPAQTLVWDKHASDALQNSQRLVVVLLDPTDLTTDKKLLKNKALFKAYENYTTVFNDMLRQTVPAHWRLTKQIDFLTPVEVIGLRGRATASELEQTLVLHFPKVKNNFLLAAQKLKKSQLAAFDTDKHRIKTDAGQAIYLHSLNYMTRFAENAVYAGPSFALCTFDGTQGFISASELAFAVENMQDLLVKQSKGLCNQPYCWNFDAANKNKLTTKTLLIPQEFVETAKNGKRTITDAELNNAFSMPWKLATWKEIDEAVAKQDATKAVLFSTRYTTAGPQYGTYFWAVDALDARTVLGFSTPVENGPDGYDLDLRRVGELVRSW